MLEVFTTNEYDSKIAVTDGINNYTFYDLKRLIAAEINFLKNKKDNVVIIEGDNFSFIIQFWAALFCSKKVYLITDKNRLKNLDFEYDVLEGYVKEPSEFLNYDIDILSPLVNFYTSGSSGTPKLIKKSLNNLIVEAKDAGKELKLSQKNYTVMSSTTMCHLFGITMHLFVPLCNGLVISTKNISYPEDIDVENAILISTPTFLCALPKFDSSLKIPPKYIITAGSKLNKELYEYFEKQSDIIEIYGSTETGIIAHKIKYEDDFVLFNNVNIQVNGGKAEVQSEYIYEKKIVLNDDIEINNRYLKLNNRTDRLYKIYEKRVDAEEIEYHLKLNKFVNDCYITKSGEKLVCLCALSKLGQEFLLSNNISALTKNLKRHLYEVSEIVPQKWKFIDEIPMTKAGKINKNIVEHIFNINLSLPVILDRKLSENSITYRIFFYHQCNFFNGHFPEYKLVPGVIQLYLAKEFANIHFDLSLGQGQWKRIKFSNIIEPDSIINLKLERDEKQVSYEFFSETQKYASGTFLCENIFEGCCK